MKKKKADIFQVKNNIRLELVLLDLEMYWALLDQ